MAILRQQLPPLLRLPPLRFHSSSPKPCIFHLSKTSTLFSLYSSPPPPSIFLPFLEDPEEEQPPESVSDEEEEDPQDPIVRFLKSRALTEDPQTEGKFSLQKNRRTSWHLAELLEDSEPVSEPDPVEDSPEIELGRASSDVVDQILDKARNLGEILTLGEELGGFEGKVGEKECMEVLELIGREEGLLRCCLHFYEWMCLRDVEEDMPRGGLVSPRACSVLFPVLGRGGMGEEVLVLFRNLPMDRKEFCDVRVYNAAISGLMCSKRYDDAWKVYETMEADNILSDHVTCSIMITIMRKLGGQHSKLPQLLKGMEVLNLKPDSVTYSTMIYAYIRVRDFSRAFFYHKKMVKSGQVPAARSYEKMRAILDVKLARKNKKDQSAILGIINSKMGMLKFKKKVKKDEFWKTKKKRYGRPDNAPNNTNS